MKKFLSLVLILILVIGSGLANIVNAEVTGAKCLVRIEGLSGTIAEGYGTGTTAAQAAIDVLSRNKIQYTGNKDYLSEIDNIKSGSIQGGYDGWMSYVKHSDGKTVDQPYPYTPAAGDEIVFYYSNKDMNTPFVNSIKFNPEIVKVNEPFTITFSWNHDIYDSNWNPTLTNTPITKVNVKIDNENYVTDNNGQINIKGLHNGKHTYEISRYNNGQPPSAVMDKGSFTMDGKTASGFNYTDSSYDSTTRDNNQIVENINNEINSTSKVLAPVSDNWVALDMSKLGINSNREFLLNLSQDISSNGEASYSNTDLEKYIIGITAAGYNPYNFAGENLVSELYNRQLNDFQINDLIFGLITYNYTNIPDNYNIKKSDIVNAILNKSLSNTGGWSLSGNSLDADITGMAISSLASYYNKDIKVKLKIDQAVQALSNMENNSGYIGSSNGITSETLSMVIVGLTSIGIDPGASPFAKSNGNLVTALLSFKGNKGMYKHNLKGDDDYIATEEALRALIALQKLKTSVSYNFYSSNIDVSSLPVYSYNLKSSNTKAIKIDNTVEPTAATSKDVQVVKSPISNKESEDTSKKNQVNKVNSGTKNKAQSENETQNTVGNREMTINPNSGEKIAQDKTKVNKVNGNLRKGIFDSTVLICGILIIAAAALFMVVLRKKEKNFEKKN
ncbi:hypothetical protein [Clostridium pasteurianum]|uniref:DUF4430 domain-containing protein n=1 Tax=Clostridium pasteurianum BC1 TaxID=86416 RepID=R4K5Q7_CLOPA|nr:hypothetical protein [Clostridium pasteurianum]AGK98492.1 hypothetical protein Clopa_3713 [Clostridium pasteurianum BC1]